MYVATFVGAVGTSAYMYSSNLIGYNLVSVAVSEGML